MNDFDRWEKIAEWRGHTIATLEAMNRELKQIKTTQYEIQKSLINTRIKVATLGGISGLIVSVIVMLLKYNF